jgi:hypothetical protein
MSLADISAHDVIGAVREFDELGRDAFLDRYRFGPARRYFLEIDGRLYDAKAVVGVAHQYARPDLGPLPADSFHGGRPSQRVLERNGFAVVVEDQSSRAADHMLPRSS